MTMKYLTTMGLTLVLAGACSSGAGQESAAPDESNEEEFIGAGSGDYRTEEQKLDDEFGKRAALPARPTPVEKCEGEGEEKKCALADPDPATSSAHAARAIMGNVRWGMSPERVLEQLGKRMDAEHSKLMSQTADVTAQDEARKQHEEAKKLLATQRVKFEAGAEHIYKSSFLNGEYVEGQGEEMIFIGAGVLREFFLFKDGKLWKVIQAHSRQKWPEKKYAQVIAEHFAKEVSHSPEVKEDRDEKSAEVRLRWNEWTTADGDHLRVFDVMDAHGVIAVSLTHGEAEASHGIRLPNNELDAAFREENLSEVMAAEGLCYDADGNMVADAAQCAGAEKGDKKGKGKGKKGQGKKGQGKKGKK